MRFQPKTEKEVAEAGLLPNGVYDFEVIDANEKQSKKGNDMVELKIRLYDAEGAARTIFDYLVDTEGGAYKIRHFAAATGMLENYERGELRAEDMAGKSGSCQVAIQKDKTGQYPDKNTVRDYLSDEGGAPRAAPKAKIDAEMEDEIPF